PSVERLAISAASASLSRTCDRRFMIVSLDTSRPSTRHQTSYVVLLEGARFSAPMTHTLLDSRHGASPVRLEISPLPGLVFSDRDSHSPSNRPSRADRRLSANGRPLLFCVNDIEKIWGNHSLHAPTRANIPTSPYGSR